MPLGNATPSATCRAEPSGATNARNSGGELASRKVKAGVADIGVAPTVHDDVVPGMLREAAQVGMGHERPVMLPSQQEPIACQDDKQTPIGEPVDAERE